MGDINQQLAAFGLRMEIRSIKDLKPYPSNPRKHTPDNLGAIEFSIHQFGFKGAVLVDQDGVIIAGHGRVQAAKALGQDQVPVLVATDLDKAQAQALRVADNAIPLLAQWDVPTLAAELDVLADHDYTGMDLGFDPTALDQLLQDMGKERQGPSGDGADKSKNGYKAGSLAERFVVPPFSVLDTRQGYWMDRKAAWLGLGIQGEIGRDVRAYHSREWAQEHGQTNGLGAGVSGTSVFDPVLCELAYRWFAPAGGKVLDPFAGGSVRGVVAGRLGLTYTGFELRQEQIDANRIQADAILTQGGDVMPTWVQGDSRVAVPAWTGGPADLVFTCPPYFDLEVYSDDPADLSAMADYYNDFRPAYRAILKACADQLADDRFMVLVVGDVRAPSGAYYGLDKDTVNLVLGLEHPMAFYNEGILINQAGSLPVRVASQFNLGRKLGRMHQHVLVFYKGQLDHIGDVFGPVDAGRGDGDANHDDGDGGAGADEPAGGELDHV